MTGVDASAPPRPQPPDPRLRITLPGSRGGLAWLAVLLLIGAFVTFQVGRQVYASWSIGQEAERIRAEIAAVETENATLLRELAYLRSEAYISAEARRLLNLGRPGEHVLIIPPGAEAALPPALQEDVTPPAPLLEQWLELFFGP
ncbi:MAG TPA: septum formation initiator family protein [Candidatus Dormibacteraeota bacterium]|nr:septum formation initiator family protein [Candidatus Dormibacteraeota bacterium]